jgi:nucleoside-diphosphate-sugar epimerase
MPERSVVFEKKNILVTGGAGFIGSFLCEALLKQGNARVICLDNFVTSQESYCAPYEPYRLVCKYSKPPR